MSANAALYEAQDKREREKRELDRLSVAPSQAYQGFNKVKKVAKKTRDTSKLPRNIMDQIDHV